MNPFLTVEGLTLGYGTKRLVENLSFSVNTGDYLCVLGENGSGKSTLLKALLGLQAPICGSFHYASKEVRSGIGYLPQQTEIQRDFPASVQEIVRSGNAPRLGWRPFFSRKQKEHAGQAIRQMGIESLRHACYRDLSGGQQQRVLLARAMVAAEEALFLDEPVTGLDPATATALYGFIDAWHRDGRTVVMVTHDVQEALLHATHILRLGAMPFFGSMEAYMDTASGHKPAIFHGKIEGESQC